MNLPLERLSPREYEILGLIADGLTTKEILERLHISPHTLKFHKRSLIARGGWPTLEAACAWYGWNRCERLGQYGLVLAVESLLEHVRRVGA